MKNKAYNIGLPKWPALIVVGKPVTPDQAKEILIRTDSFSTWGFSSNDHQFDAQLNEAVYGIKTSGRFGDLDEAISKKMGLDPKGFNWSEIEMYKREKTADLGILENIHYLHNHRVVSSYVGGPHGWCDWEGKIGCCSYNIGKWPSVDEVHKEWKEIAKAFPYLDITCQLLSGESCEVNVVPVVEFRIKNGKVTAKDARGKKMITELEDDHLTENLAAIFSNSGNRERGCTITQFHDALRHTKEKNRFENDHSKNQN